MLFSILIANYNNGHFFIDCYYSIIKQTYTNWEVIIVDDGSNDNSLEVIKKTIGKDSRFKLYGNDKNRGCGYTKNRCCEYANGDVLGFLDPDDAIKSNALEVMVNAHKTNKEAAIITSNYELVDLNLNIISKGLNATAIPKEKSYLTYGEGALTAFASFKNEAYKKTLGINPLMKRAVDQDLYYKLEEQGNHVYLENFFYLYRIHKNSISENENIFKARYWHYYAKKSAYNRRKANNSEIDNFSNNFFKKYESNYFLNRFENSKNNKEFKIKLYFLCKSIYAAPFHKPIRKIKSLLLLIKGRI
ncbi:glycosyltransferase family 2 protein [Polaribacter sp. IC073]|uniref:glycosyltransferase family 2 protein n=1 Tax=Polaribacter sp. IC073 TaxID=2508540 RepID=UPI0011BE02DA|nr:glycosyltransferase family 2 protein [Polaribacter sp. IC073]TXD49113.1 glycosyltransferase family 2 protein [Polaribacter sp. IC073]